MAKPKPKPEKLVDQVDDDVDDFDGDADAAASIAAALDASPDGAEWKISVFRVLGPAKKGFKQPWVMDCTRENVVDLHQMLRDRARGGDFRVNVLKNGKFFRSHEISVEPPIDDVVTPAPAAAESEISRALAQLAARIDALAAPAQSDPWENLDRMTSVMQKLQPPASDRSNAQELIDAMMRGMELSKKYSGGAGEPSFLNDVSNLLAVPAISGFIENASTVMAKAAGVAPAAPGAAAAPARAPNDTAPPAAGDTNAAVLRSVGYLLQKAQANSDPKFYAAWFEDNTPRGVVKQLLALPNLGDRVVQMVPAFKEFRGWLDELLFELQAIITETEGPGDQANNAAGSDQSKTA